MHRADPKGKARSARGKPPTPYKCKVRCQVTPARRYSCEYYTTPDAVTRTVELLAALPRDRGYWFQLHHMSDCPCEPKRTPHGFTRAPLSECSCGMLWLTITEATITEARTS